MKKFNLAVEDQILRNLEKAARVHANGSVTELLRKFISIGFYVLSVLESPTKKLVVIEGDKQTEIVII